MTQLICFILFLNVSVIAGNQTHFAPYDIFGDCNIQEENSLARLSNKFIGFLAIADVKEENALIVDEDVTYDDRENNLATRRSRARRRRDNRLRRVNNRRPNRSPDSKDNQENNNSQNLRRRKERRIRRPDDNEQTD